MGGGMIPFLAVGEEGIWVFSIELEGLSYVGPAQRARG